MNGDLNKKLLEAKEQKRAKTRLKDILCKTRQSLEQEKERLDGLERRLKKEEADVKRLEGMSLSGMFHEILGRKEEKLDKERQEFLAAKLKYDECRHSVSAMERDILLTEKRLQELGDPEAAYAALFKEKESLVLKDDQDKLFQLNDHLADLNSEVKEAKEAIDAGEKVLVSIENVLLALKKAKTWGVVDIVGGGLIITAVKHSKIDKANQLAQQVQHLLRNFQRELADVQADGKSPLSVDISGFSTFADYFFDGLIFDWIVQSKINKSYNNVMDMKEKVVRVVGDLNTHLKTKEKKKLAGEKEKRAIIEGA